MRPCRTRHVARICGAIVWLGLAATSASGCGGARAARDVETVDLAPRPQPGVRYEIRHRETRQVSGHPPTEIETRTLLEVVEALPDGTRRVRVRVFRTVGEGGQDERLLDEIATLDVSASGALIGDPVRQCGGIDELRLGRYLRHLLGARAFVAVRIGEGSRWRGEYFSDAIELASPATFRLDEIGGTAVRGRISSRIEMHDGDIGRLRVSGTGRVRGRFSVSLNDGFAGSTDLRSQIEGTVFADGAERRARIRTRSQIRVRRRPGGSEYSLSCEFDPAVVTAHFTAHLRQIQTCYESLLANDVQLSGRVLVRFTLHPDGHIRNARAEENSSGSDELSECVVRELGTLRIDPAPRDGPVQFAFPFVFAPQH